MLKNLKGVVEGAGSKLGNGNIISVFLAKSVWIDIEIQYWCWIEILKIYIDQYWNIEILWTVGVGLLERLKFSIFYNIITYVY